MLGEVMSEPDRDRWYWCLRHERPEHEGEQCPAQDRLGPYSSRQEALNWREKAEARDERWREQDRQWEGEDEDGES
jgi:hypothetical protein